MYNIYIIKSLNLFLKIKYLISKGEDYKKLAKAILYLYLLFIYSKPTKEEILELKKFIK